LQIPGNIPRAKNLDFLPFYCYILARFALVYFLWEA